MSADDLVIVALSGGVDSAVTALLLKRAGRDVQCLHMTNWEDDGYCDAAADFQDARRLCRQLGLPLHRVNFSDQYRERVFAEFLAQARAGLTPNPDVLCNREIKFGVLRDYARRLGGRWLATGHYARLRQADDGVRLLKGADPDKDQSYFLHAVRGADLADVLFPLGELRKRQVRVIAREAGLGVARKKDSTGICFIGERPFAEFVGRYIRPEPGPIRDVDGHVLGRHTGLAGYTVGQRHGLGIGGRAGADGAPWYVAAKDVEHNALIVVQGANHPLLFHSRLRAGRPHRINDVPPGLAAGRLLRCEAKTRYRQPAQPCSVRLVASGGLEVDFDRPQRAVTPGQYVVLYDGEHCLGGATIIAAGHREDVLRAAG